MNKTDCTNLDLEVREGYGAIKSLWWTLDPWKELFGSVAPASRGEHVTAVMQHSRMIMQIADDIDSAAMACRSAAETLGECDPVMQYKKWFQAMPRTRSLARDGYDAFHRSVSAVREHRESEPKETKHHYDLYRSLQIASGNASQLAGRAIDYQAHSVDAIAWSTIYQAGHVKKIEINCREGAVSGGRALGISSTQAIRELVQGEPSVITAMECDRLFGKGNGTTRKQINEKGTIRPIAGRKGENGANLYDRDQLLKTAMRDWGWSKSSEL